MKDFWKRHKSKIVVVGSVVGGAVIGSIVTIVIKSRGRDVLFTTVNVVDALNASGRKFPRRDIKLCTSRESLEKLLKNSAGTIDVDKVPIIRFKNIKVK